MFRFRKTTPINLGTSDIDSGNIGIDENISNEIISPEKELSKNREIPYLIIFANLREVLKKLAIDILNGGYCPRRSWKVL